MCVLRGHGGPREQTGICNPRREASAETVLSAAWSGLRSDTQDREDKLPQTGAGALSAGCLSSVPCSRILWMCNRNLLRSQKRVLLCTHYSLKEDRGGRFYYDFFPKWTPKVISFILQRKCVFCKTMHSPVLWDMNSNIVLDICMCLV